MKRDVKLALVKVSNENEILTIFCGSCAVESEGTQCNGQKLSLSLQFSVCVDNLSLPNFLPLPPATPYLLALVWEGL